MKILSLPFFLAVIVFSSCQPQKSQEDNISYSGNPVFPGWYADPEGIIFDDEY